MEAVEAIRQNTNRPSDTRQTLGDLQPRSPVVWDAPLVGPVILVGDDLEDSGRLSLSAALSVPTATYRESACF